MAMAPIPKMRMTSNANADVSAEPIPQCIIKILQRDIGITLTQRSPYQPDNIKGGNFNGTGNHCPREHRA